MEKVNAPANRRMPIAYVVSGKFKKQENAESEANATKKTWLNINLKNKLRLMLLNFVNKLQNQILTTYHIEINFKLKDSKTKYRLELLADLRNDKECDNLINQISEGLMFNFRILTTNDRIIEGNFEKDQIKSSFENKLLEKAYIRFTYKRPFDYSVMKPIKIEGDMVTYFGYHEHQINVLNSGNITTKEIQNLLAVEIDPTDFYGRITIITPAYEQNKK